MTYVTFVYRTQTWRRNRMHTRADSERLKMKRKIVHNDLCVLCAIALTIILQRV